MRASEESGWTCINESSTIKWEFLAILVLVALSFINVFMKLDQVMAKSDLRERQQFLLSKPFMCATSSEQLLLWLTSHYNKHFRKTNDLNLETVEPRRWKAPIANLSRDLGCKKERPHWEKHKLDFGLESKATIMIIIQEICKFPSWTKMICVPSNANLPCILNNHINRMVYVVYVVL